MKTNKTLDSLVAAGALQSYNYVNLDENGIPSENRKGYANRERLELVFPDGQKLKVETYSSGCLENTGLAFLGSIE